MGPPEQPHPALHTQPLPGLWARFSNTSSFAVYFTSCHRCCSLSSAVRAVSCREGLTEGSERAWGDQLGGQGRCRGHRGLVRLQQGWPVPCRGLVKPLSHEGLWVGPMGPCGARQGECSVAAPTRGLGAGVRVRVRCGRLWSSSWVRNALKWGHSCCRAAPWGHTGPVPPFGASGAPTVLQEVVTPWGDPGMPPGPSVPWAKDPADGLQTEVR